MQVLEAQTSSTISNTGVQPSRQVARSPVSKASSRYRHDWGKKTAASFNGRLSDDGLNDGLLSSRRHARV
tara:strand:- start:359 stop:568 length:210 start_codon:yes stop_codon:yes gene_type:complete